MRCVLLLCHLHVSSYSWPYMNKGEAIKTLLKADYLLGVHTVCQTTLLGCLEDWLLCSELILILQGRIHAVIDRVLGRPRYLTP